MSNDCDETYAAFRESVRTFISKQLDPRYEGFIADRGFDREIWRIAGKQDLLGLEVPEEYGGSAAGDWTYNAILGEELSRYTIAANSVFAIHYDVVAPYLVELTTDEQRQRWLPGFCSGELVSAIAMTESGGGSDLAALKTSAVRDGSDWVLNGSKTFITNGYTSDLTIVAAKTSPDKRARGITLFVVEAGMPGFERGRKLDKVGQSESETAELFFQDVRVPSENVLGEVDLGFSYMMQRLPQERLSAAVANLAHAAQILVETLEYIRSRKAFGQSIGSFQSVKFQAAEMVTEIDVTQAYVDQCIKKHASKELTSTDAAKAKWWTADVQSRVLDQCVQLHGGYGYMNEYRVAKAWRDARVTRIWAGTNEIMKELIGRDLDL